MQKLEWGRRTQSCRGQLDSESDRARRRRGEPEGNAEPSPAATCTDQNPRPAHRDGAPAGPAVNRARAMHHRAEATRGPTPQGQAERKRIARHRRPRRPPVPHRAGSSPIPRTPRSQDHKARRPSTGGPRASTPQPGGAHNGRAAQCTTKGRSPSARTSRMQSADNQPIQRDPAPTLRTTPRKTDESKEPAQTQPRPPHLDAS